MNQVCHCPQGLSDQWGCWNGAEAMGNGDSGEGPGPRPARVLAFCTSAACSGLHRPGGSWPVCGEWHSRLPQTAIFFFWSSPKDVDRVAQCVLTLVRLALGWMPTGHFWGRVELKEARGPVSGSVLRSSHEWLRQRGEGGGHTLLGVRHCTWPMNQI